MKTQSSTFPAIPSVNLPLKISLLEKLRMLREDLRSNPLANPIELLALEVSKKIGEDKLELETVDQLVQELMGRTFFLRAQRLHSYVGETTLESNQKRIQDCIRGLTTKNGAPVSFENFRKIVERELVGIVITAHPTFSINAELNRRLAQLASLSNENGKPLSADDIELITKEATTRHHRPQNDLTLLFEQELSLEAIQNIQYALHLVYEQVVVVAQEIYPENWKSLRPKLVTIASWVGYDLDGRSDIDWNDTLLTRIRVSVLQLSHYENTLESICALNIGTQEEVILQEAKARLRITREESQKALALLPDANKETDVAAKLSQQFIKTKDQRLVDALEILDLLTRAIEITTNIEAQTKLFILKSELANLGLAMAHTHVRLNATQLHNAIRRQVGISGDPDTSGNRRFFLQELSDLLENVEPVEVNFGSILTEGTSAKRLFMLLSQIFKHVDATSPIRFLIAECDTPFTVLTALYYAKLFGIEDKVDISPLFETATALERGETIIEKLLENKHYVEYVKKRKRLCIQTGFSDAGRYLGQIAASMAIERLRMKLARLLGASELSGIELVIFDTHGESIGRGSHPVSFRDRLDYVSPPASLELFEKNNLHFKQEVSFQGGDGYVYFLTKQLAFATISRILEKSLTPPETALSDSFYTDTDYSLDFFLTIKEYNQRTFTHPNYGSLLNAFGPNLLYPTGSRMVRRQHESASQEPAHRPSQIRAIPHNAILQQMGLWANSVGGLGRAIAKDDERFLKLYKSSARCRICVAMVAYAHELSSLEVLGAYISLWNPDYWFQRLKTDPNPQRRRDMRSIGELLDKGSKYEKLRRMFRRFRKDTLDLNAGLKLVREEHRLSAQASKYQQDLDLLHGLRVALISELFILAMRVPKFTNQASTTMETVIERLMSLEIVPSLEILRRAFPKDKQPLTDELFGEIATYRSDSEQGYEKEHDELFEPIGALYETIRKISLAICHIAGAIG